MVGNLMDMGQIQMPSSQLNSLPVQTMNESMISVFCQFHPPPHVSMESSWSPHGVRGVHEDSVRTMISLVIFTL